jgi:hypothetical protein
MGIRIANKRKRLFVTETVNERSGGKKVRGRYVNMGDEVIKNECLRYVGAAGSSTDVYYYVD